MRKMMNKKGFSLVELMIVVVIMGILVAVAIPLYGAIQDNAKNNTCESNVDVIKQNAANYYAMHGVAAKSDADAENGAINDAGLAIIKSMFDDNQLPDCPWDDNDANDDYVITQGKVTGSVKVACNNETKANAKHWDVAGDGAPTT